jgi:hypothetical protein
MKNLFFAIAFLVGSASFAASMPQQGKFQIENLVGTYDLVKCSDPTIEYKFRPKIRIAGDANELIARHVMPPVTMPGTAFSYIYGINQGPQKDNSTETTAYTTANGIFSQGVTSLGWFKKEIVQESFVVNTDGTLTYAFSDSVGSDSASFSCSFTRAVNE